MDNTIIIGIAFKAVWILIALTTVALCVSISASFRKQIQEFKNVDFFDAVKNQKLKLITLLLLGIVIYYANTTESVYRPKNQIKAVVRPSDRFSGEKTFHVVSTNATWEQRVSSNRIQNAEAQKQFDKLLDAK